MTPATAVVPATSPADQAVVRGFDVDFLPAAVRVGHMRRITAAHLRQWGLAVLTDTATPAVSELVTNAVQHGQGNSIALRVRRSAHELRIEVTDGTPALARLRSASEADENGRRLFLVAALAEDWGVSLDGTMTWCTFAVPGGGREGRGSGFCRRTSGLDAAPATYHNTSVTTVCCTRRDYCMTQVTLDPDRAARLRDQVVDQLVADGTIASKDVEAAMRKVPRHLFTPDAPLERAYDTYAAVITKVDEHGVQLSSVSAPQIQALMLEQAELGPGMRVLEIGSGGLNAAYLAELVGSGGEVTTVDIDAEVTDRAARLLGDNGYDQVRVVTADAAEPIPDLGQVDAIVVTVGAWDIPPAWMDQLKLHGRLVVPLRMRGLTRSVAFARVADHLESESAKICGFVPMQGSTAHQEEQLLVTGEPEIALRFDDGLPPEPHRLDNAVRTPRVGLRTGVTIGVSELLDTLQMHLAITLPGFCTMAVDPELDTGIVAPANKGWSLAAVDGPNFAYLTHHRDEDGKHVEFAVHALGPDAPAFAEKVAGHLRGWARERRGGPCPVIRVYPAGTPDDQVLGDRVIDKVHSRISLSWPSV